VYLLLLEVNEVFVVLEDLDVGEGTPRSLYFLHRHLLFSLTLDFLPSLFVPSPCPLDLNRCNMVHGEPMVFEKSSS
jgi:hypothetical protein